MGSVLFISAAQAERAQEKVMLDDYDSSVRQAKGSSVPLQGFQPILPRWGNVVQLQACGHS